MDQLLGPPAPRLGERLNKLPREIKDMIYKLVFQDSPSGRTPALLIALRPKYDDGEYLHALKLYYQTTLVNLGRNKSSDSLKNGYRLVRMNKDVITYVTRLEVSFKGNWKKLRPNIDGRAHGRIREMTNLRDLVLDFSLVAPQSQVDYIKIVQQWVPKLKLHRITIVPNPSPASPPILVFVQLGELEVPRPGPQTIETLNHALRVPGRLANVTGLYDSCFFSWQQTAFPGERRFPTFRVHKFLSLHQTTIFHDIWFWESARGSFLTWVAPGQAPQPN